MERDQEQFEESLKKMLNDQIEKDLIDKYEFFLNECKDKSKTKIYYVYTIYLIKNGQSVIKNIKYFSKDKGQRCLTQLRVAFLCMKFKIRLSTLKTQYLIDEIKKNGKFGTNKTSKEEEVDALVRETMLIKLGNPGLLNLAKSSLNLDNLNLDKELLNEVQKATIKELFSNDNNKRQIIDLEWLKNVFQTEKEFVNYIIGAKPNSKVPKVCRYHKDLNMRKCIELSELLRHTRTKLAQHLNAIELDFGFIMFLSDPPAELRLYLERIKQNKIVNTPTIVIELDQFLNRINNEFQIGKLTATGGSVILTPQRDQSDSQSDDEHFFVYEKKLKTT